MKKIWKMIFVLSILVGLSACSAVIAEKGEDYSGKTLTGQINEIEGTTVYLQLGKLKKAENNEMPEMSGDFEGQMPQFDGSEIPEMPDGFDFEMPEDFEGSAPEGSFDQMPGQFGSQNGNMPEIPNGQRPERPEGFNGERPEGLDSERPEMPEGFDGQMPQGNPGQMTNEGGGGMSQMPNMEQGKTVYIFKKKSQTVSISLKGAEVTLADGSIGTVSDLKVGDVVQIVVDENNNISSVTVCEISEVIED